MAELFTQEPFDENPDETPRPCLLRLGDLRAAWAADAEAGHSAHCTGRPRGAVTRFPMLDRELGGALAPGLHVLHGQPGTGKTALALQIGGTCGCPALYLSSEMGSLELMRRVVARVTGTYLGRLKSGELSPSPSLALFDQACAAVPDLFLADATRAFAPLEWLRDVACVVRGGSEHLLIVIDSVHSWVEASAVEAAEYDMLNAGLADLGQLAATLECAILAIAERNRASMKTGGLSAGAGTRKFEYRAETVLDLAADVDAIDDAAGETDVVVKLEKNRHGRPGRKFPLKFHGALQRFREA